MRFELIGDVEINWDFDWEHIISATNWFHRYQSFFVVWKMGKQIVRAFNGIDPGPANIQPLSQAGWGPRQNNSRFFPVLNRCNFCSKLFSVYNCFNVSIPSGLQQAWNFPEFFAKYQVFYYRRVFYYLIVVRKATMHLITWKRHNRVYLIVSYHTRVILCGQPGRANMGCWIACLSSTRFWHEKGWLYPILSTFCIPCSQDTPHQISLLPWASDVSCLLREKLIGKSFKLSWTYWWPV